MSLVVEEFQLKGSSVREDDLKNLEKSMLSKVMRDDQKEQIRTVFDALNRRDKDIDMSTDQLNMLSTIIKHIDQQMEIAPEDLQSAISGQFFIAHTLLDHKKIDQPKTPKKLADLETAPPTDRQLQLSMRDSHTTRELITQAVREHELSKNILSQKSSSNSNILSRVNSETTKNFDIQAYDDDRIKEEDIDQILDVIEENK